MWALFHSKTFLDGFNQLLKAHATANTLAVYGALAGALFGEADLPR